MYYTLIHTCIYLTPNKLKHKNTKNSPQKWSENLEKEREKKRRRRGKERRKPREKRGEEPQP